MIQCNVTQKKGLRTLVTLGGLSPQSDMIHLGPRIGWEGVGCEMTLYICVDALELDAWTPYTLNVKEPQTEPDDKRYSRAPGHLVLLVAHFL